MNTRTFVLLFGLFIISVLLTAGTSMYPAVFLLLIPFFFLHDKIVFLACSAGILCGIGYGMTWKSSTSGPLPDPVTVGIVKSFPFERNERLIFTLQTQQGTHYEVRSMQVLPIEYGDTVRISGRAMRPEPFITHSGTLFRYDRHMEAQRITAIINAHEVELIKESTSLLVPVFSFRTFATKTIERLVMYPENVLLTGILLGDRKGFSEELTYAMQRSGTIHIVALSGYNVTIVAQSIAFILAPLGIVIGYSGGIVAIILFIIMTGLLSTGVRSGIMAIVLLTLRFFGTTEDIPRVLLFTLFIVTLWNPFLLLYDVSFHLSFIATVAVLYGTPLIERYAQGISNRFYFRETISATLAATIGVSPYLAYSMGSFSLIGSIANILIIPLIPLTMFFGTVGIFVSLFYSGIAIIPFYIAERILSYFLFIIEITASFPYAVISSTPSFVIMILWYVFIIVGYISLRSRSN
jgi:competence protein ComEC